MFWIVPAWILSSVVTFLLGYHYKRVVQRVEQLEESVKLKVDKSVEEPKSELIDPYDEVQTAIYENKKMMERLNDK